MSQVRQLQLAELWERCGRGAGVVIGLLDSGVATSRRALPPSRVTALDHLGQPTSSYSVVHGTNCAGVLASEHPRALGVAPEAKLISYQLTLSSGVVVPRWVAGAILDGLARGVDLFSCSFNLPVLEPALLGALRESTAGGVPVFAAAHPRGLPTPFPDFAPEITVVGAQGRGEGLAPGVRLSPWVDLVAPSTELTTVDAYGRPAVWAEAGASGATAITAGIGALLLAHFTARRRVLGRALPGLLNATARELSGPLRPGVKAKVLDVNAAFDGCMAFMSAT